MSSSSDSDLEEALLLYAVATSRKRKREWIQETNIMRNEDGEYHRLSQELSANENLYHKYFHMSKDRFDELHRLLGPIIRKRPTKMRAPISSRERLAITLRYLATGLPFKKLAKSFRIGISTMRGIVYEVCQGMRNVLQPECMPFPTEETWKLSEMGYRTVWNFPNCIGSIDGKRVRIRRRKQKGFIDKSNSLVLFTIVDPYKKFLALDIGYYEIDKDQDVFENSHICKTIVDEKSLLFDKPLPGSKEPVPHVFIGDESFILKKNLMRPFPKASIANNEKRAYYNKRLRMALSVVESAFNMLGQKWPILLRQIDFEIDTAMAVIRAPFILHNFIMQDSKQLEEVEKKSEPMRAFAAHRPNKRRATNVACMTREKFVTYFDQNKTND